jgi:hypothetical protein
MTHRIFGILTAGLALAGFAPAQQTHPDLSGTWAYSIELPPAALKKEVAGAVQIKGVDFSGRRPATTPVAGALPSTAAPSSKPQFQTKVKDLFDHESKTDHAFYCGKPGIPRIGPPRKIVQLPKEMIFLYEKMSPHRADANPSYYGGSIGHWAGNTLVDVTNFVDDTWFGEGGYFHTDAMQVTERFWRDGANLAYQVTVEDQNVLTAPWTMAPRVVKPSAEPLEESPRCAESDASKLINSDHHGQR